MNLKHEIGKQLIPMCPFNRRVFDTIRFEIGNIIQNIKNKLNPAYHRKINRLKKMKDIAINIGCGPTGRQEEWINIDARLHHPNIYIAHDIRKRFPLNDDQVKMIFAEQVIEHIDFKYDVPQVFKEFYRILKPGGIVRIIVPDLTLFMEAFVSKDNEKWKAIDWNLETLPDDLYTPMHVINHMFHQNGEHLFGYDYETLAYALKEAGFDKIEKQQYQQSWCDELMIDQESHRPYSLYVEAQK